MSLRIEIDRTRHLRLVTLSGVVDDDELLETFSRYWKSPDYDGSLNEFCDVSGLERIVTTTSGLRKLAKLNLELRRDAELGVKSAVFAPGDLPFGLSRMFQAFVEGSKNSFEVFRDREKAFEWLEQSEESKS